MGVIQIDLPENVLISTGQSREEFIREAKYFLAIKLFELGRLSSGRAAALCGIPRVEFLLRAGHAGIALVDLQDAELDREFDDA
jgi:predicted HTH domain antitoxin